MHGGVGAAAAGSGGPGAMEWSALCALKSGATLRFLLESKQETDSEVSNRCTSSSTSTTSAACHSSYNKRGDPTRTGFRRSQNKFEYLTTSTDSSFTTASTSATTPGAASIGSASFFAGVSSGDGPPPNPSCHPHPQHHLSSASRGPNPIPHCPGHVGTNRGASSVLTAAVGAPEDNFRTTSASGTTSTAGAGGNINLHKVVTITEENGEEACVGDLLELLAEHCNRRCMSRDPVEVALYDERGGEVAADTPLRWSLFSADHDAAVTRRAARITSVSLDKGDPGGRKVTMGVKVLHEQPQMEDFLEGHEYLNGVERHLPDRSFDAAGGMNFDIPAMMEQPSLPPSRRDENRREERYQKEQASAVVGGKGGDNNINIGHGPGPGSQQQARPPPPLHQLRGSGPPPPRHPQPPPPPPHSLQRGPPLHQQPPPKVDAPNFANYDQFIQTPPNVAPPSAPSGGRGGGRGGSGSGGNAGSQLQPPSVPVPQWDYYQTGGNQNGPSSTLLGAPPPPPNVPIPNDGGWADHRPFYPSNHRHEHHVLSMEDYGMQTPPPPPPDEFEDVTPPPPPQWEEFTPESNHNSTHHLSWGRGMSNTASASSHPQHHHAGAAVDADNILSGTGAGGVGGPPSHAPTMISQHVMSREPPNFAPMIVPTAAGGNPTGQQHQNHQAGHQSHDQHHDPELVVVEADYTLDPGEAYYAMENGWESMDHFYAKYHHDHPDHHVEEQRVEHHQVVEPPPSGEAATVGTSSSSSGPPYHLMRPAAARGAGGAAAAERVVELENNIDVREEHRGQWGMQGWITTGTGAAVESGHQDAGLSRVLDGGGYETAYYHPGEPMPERGTGGPGPPIGPGVGGGVSHLLTPGNLNHSSRGGAAAGMGTGLGGSSFPQSAQSGAPFADTSASILSPPGTTAAATNPMSTTSGSNVQTHPPAPRHHYHHPTAAATSTSTFSTVYRPTSRTPPPPTTGPPPPPPGHHTIVSQHPSFQHASKQLARVDVDSSIHGGPPDFSGNNPPQHPSTSHGPQNHRHQPQEGGRGVFVAQHRKRVDLSHECATTSATLEYGLSTETLDYREDDAAPADDKDRGQVEQSGHHLYHPVPLQGGGTTTQHHGVDHPASQTAVYGGHGTAGGTTTLTGANWGTTTLPGGGTTMTNTTFTTEDAVDDHSTRRDTGSPFSRETPFRGTTPEPHAQQQAQGPSQDGTIRRRQFAIRDPTTGAQIDIQRPSSGAAFREESVSHARNAANQSMTMMNRAAKEFTPGSAYSNSAGLYSSWDSDQDRRGPQQQGQSEGPSQSQRVMRSSSLDNRRIREFTPGALYHNAGPAHSGSVVVGGGNSVSLNGAAPTGPPGGPPGCTPDLGVGSGGQHQPQQPGTVGARNGGPADGRKTFETEQQHQHAEFSERYHPGGAAAQQHNNPSGYNPPNPYGQHHMNGAAQTVDLTQWQLHHTSGMQVQRNDEYQYWNGLAVQNSKSKPKSHYELRLRIDGFLQTDPHQRGGVLSDLEGNPLSFLHANPCGAALREIQTRCQREWAVDDVEVSLISDEGDVSKNVPGSAAFRLSKHYGLEATSRGPIRLIPGRD